MYPCSCLFQFLACAVRTDTTSRCVLMHLLCIRILTCRALVTVRTLALTNPGPPSPDEANPNMHRSATNVLVPGVAMIFITHFILEFTSGASSCTKWRPHAVCASYSSHMSSVRSLSFFLHPLVSDLCQTPMMTSGSLLPTMCLISSRADLTLKSQCVHVECSGRRNRHPVQCVVLDVRDPHCFLAVSVQCLLCGNCNWVLRQRRFLRGSSPNVLFSGARLLVSGFTWLPFRCDLPSSVWLRPTRVSPAVLVCTVSPHRDIASNMILAGCSSYVLRGWSVPVVVLVVWLMLRILCRSLKGLVSSPALCPAQSSSEAPTRDGRRHWSSSVCVSFLARWILSSAAASRSDPDESPTNRLSMLFRHASL